MSIELKTYTIKVNKKERKAYRNDPLGNLDDIISKVRSEFVKDEDPEPYLFVSDIELLAGSAFLKDIEPKVIRKSVCHNGNSQIRRLILEDDFRKIVEKEEQDAVVEETADHTAPEGQQYKVTVEPGLKVSVVPIPAPVVVINEHRTQCVPCAHPAIELHELPANTPVNVCKAPTTSYAPTKDAEIYGYTKVKTGGDVDETINCAVTKAEKNEGKAKGVPTTFAEVRAAVRPIVDVKYQVKADRIGDLCAAYSAELIKDNGYTKEDIRNRDRFPYREPRRLLYAEFERIFANDERVQKFVQVRDAAPKSEVDTYVKGVYAIGYIDWLLEIAEVLFEPFLAQA